MERSKSPKLTLAGNTRTKGKGLGSHISDRGSGNADRRLHSADRKTPRTLSGERLKASGPIDLAERMDGLPSRDRSPLRLLRSSNIIDFPGKRCSRRIKMREAEERLDRFLESLEAPETDMDIIA